MLSAKLKEAAGNSADATLYVDDVFSTYLYTGNGSTQTITNGIDLAGKGGLVWFKSRNVGSNHYQVDTARGNTKYLASNSTTAQMTFTDALTGFTANGFNLGADAAAGDINGTGYVMASWTFRKAPKFFDVVAFTADSSGGGTFNHSLGSVPGCVITKSTSGTGDWLVYHRSTGTSKYLELNGAAGQKTGTDWISVSSTSMTFASGYLGANNSRIAYLFAHDTDADGIIQCGSYTGNGSATGPIINLGWEPQYLLIKSSSDTGSWYIFDSMRGLRNKGGVFLVANTSAAEDTSVNIISSLATGFQPVQTGTATNGNGINYIYMAIRRPNKPPTSGTQVFSNVLRTGTGATANITGAGFPPDMIWNRNRGSGYETDVNDKLRGAKLSLFTAYTQAESDLGGSGMTIIGQDGCTVSTDGSYNANGGSFILNFFKRAPGFFDEVCYTGTGANTTQAHNLTVVPELLIIKSRSNSVDWVVGNTSLGFSNFLMLNRTDASNTASSIFNNTAPTSSVFSVGTSSGTNEVNLTYVAYLFATLAGISKVGSYTGNGTGQAIACGFSGGARFVLIKRTDSTGDWYTYDSARGLTSGSSPYLLLNSTAAEVTGNNGVYASTGGFTLATSASGLNASGGTYIFLAVA
jgi:hypothetical protein